MNSFQYARKIGYRDGMHQELEQNTLSQLATARKRIIKEVVKFSVADKEEFVSRLDDSFEEKIKEAYVTGYMIGYSENEI